MKCRIANTHVRNGNFADAVKWYSEAADLGNSEAMCRIGGVYKYGAGARHHVDGKGHPSSVHFILRNLRHFAGNRIRAIGFAWASRARKLSMTDLKKVITNAIDETKRCMEKDISLRNSEILLTSKQVMDRLAISRTTLWNWVKKKYIIPVEIGGKQRYKLSDVNAILKGDDEVFKEA